MMGIPAYHTTTRRHRGRNSAGAPRPAGGRLFARLLVLSLLASLMATAPAPASHDRTPAAAPVLEGKIVFESNRGDDPNGDVFVANADGTGAQLLAGVSGVGDRQDGFPAFSPNGTRVVFASCRDETPAIPCTLGNFTNALGNSNIFVMTPQPGSTPTALTTDLAHDTEPDFSPNGGEIVFTSFRAGNPQIFRMNANGSEQTNISNSPLTIDSDPSWSRHPEGVFEIAFVRSIQVTPTTRNDEIFVMTAAGRLQTNLTLDPASDLAPAWSPDGSKIAFSSNRSGSYRIWVMSRDGTSPQQVTFGEGTFEDTLPAWSPDGTKIAFSRGTDVASDIYVVNLADGALTNLTEGAGGRNTAPNWIENFVFDLDAAAQITIGSSPQNVPVRHFPIVSNPNAPDFEEAPFPIGLAPFPIGLAPFPIGLAPFPIGLAPGALNGLGDVLLSTIPLRPRILEDGSTLSWQYILANSSLAAQPLQSVSYKDVLDLIKAESDPEWQVVRDRLTALDLGDMDFSLSPLGRVNRFSIALGLTSLRNIDPQAVSEGKTAREFWCEPIEAQGFADCGDALAPDGSGEKRDARDLSLLELELSEVSIAAYEIQAIPLRDISFNSGEASFLQARVGRLYLGGTMGGVRLIDLNDPNSVVDCAAVDCTSPTQTLRSASAAIRQSATVANLDPQLTPLKDFELGEIVYAMSNPADNPAFDVAPLHNVLGYPGFPPDGSATEVTYRLEFAPVAASINRLRVVLPGGFAYGENAPTVVQLVNGAVTSILTVTPDVSYSTSQTEVIWEIGPQAPGTAIGLTFGAHPGLRLGGPFTASAYALDGEVVVDSRTDRAPVTVVEAFETGNSPAAATPISAGVVFLSHISAPGDVDFYSFEAPEEGSVFDVFLAHLPEGVDYDLVVYGPPTTVPEPPLRPASGAAAVLPVEDAGFPSPGEATPPDMLQDIPIVPQGAEVGPVVGVSIGRNNLSEEVRVVSGGSGSYLIQVSGFNGTSSDLPYSLRVRTRDRFALPTAPTPYLDFSVNDFVPTAPADVGADRESLILVNEGRMRALWGVSATGQVLARLATLAAHSEVEGAIVRVDASAAARQAYKEWDQSPGSPAAANEVVRAINEFVDSKLTSSHTITHVVLVGPDAILPFARLADRTLQGNERSFTGELLFTGNNPLSQAFFNGLLLSDNPYGDFGPPIPWLGGFLYVPDVGLGRVVETPEQIIAQIDLFLASNGKLDPKTALTAGADFMKDLAADTDLTLENMLGSSQPDLIGDAWTKTDLVNSFTNKSVPPDLVSINAHFDFSRLLPPAATTAAGLFTTADVAAGNPLPGRIIWSMGCHSGLNVGNALSTDPLKAFDWAEAIASKGAAVFVAQNGFGLGGQTVALSERLMKSFSERSASFASAPSHLRSVGRALAAAKKDYLGGMGLYGVYDEKVVHQTTFYGLPFFQDPTPITVPPEESGPSIQPSTQTDPVTGGPSGDWTVTPSFQRQEHAHGSYYEVASVDPCVVHYRPVQPCTGRIGVTGLTGIRPWAVVTSRRSAQNSSFNPVIANPLLAAAAKDLREPHFDGVHPSALVQITAGADRQFLVANVGQFRGNQDLGVQRLDLSMGGKIYWLPSNGRPPTILTTGSQAESPDCARPDCAVTFTAQTTSDAIAGNVLFLDDSGTGTWRFVELQQIGQADGLKTWKVDTTFAGPGLEFIFQFVGEGGVATSTGKGLAHVHRIATLPSPYTLAGPHPPDSSKTIKTGSNIPVKWNLFKDGVEIKDPKVVTSIRSYQTYSVAGGCDVLKPADLLDDPTTPNDDPKLEDHRKVSYKTNQMQFDWKTDSNWGNTCRALEIRFDDGSTHIIRYFFKS